MARGEANQVKVHYKGADEDFIVFVDDAKVAKDWKTDKSIPLAQVVSSFKTFVTNKYVVLFAFAFAYTPHFSLS
jgi:peroxiredoxin